MSWRDRLTTFTYSLVKFCSATIEKLSVIFASWSLWHGVCTPYLSELCIPVSTSAGRHFLRSATYGDLLVPRTSTSTCGPRSFVISGPMSGISYLRLCVYHRHLDSFKASWRQYFFARPTRHDSARSWLLRLRVAPYKFSYLLTYYLPQGLLKWNSCERGDTWLDSNWFIVLCRPRGLLYASCFVGCSDVPTYHWCRYKILVGEIYHTSYKYC